MSFQDTSVVVTYFGNILLLFILTSEHTVGSTWHIYQYWQHTFQHIPMLEDFLKIMQNPTNVLNKQLKLQHWSPVRRSLTLDPKWHNYRRHPNQKQWRRSIIVGGVAPMIVLVLNEEKLNAWRRGIAFSKQNGMLNKKFLDSNKFEWSKGVTFGIHSRATGSLYLLYCIFISKKIFLPQRIWGLNSILNNLNWLLRHFY